MAVTLPIGEIVEAVRGARVGLLTNGTFWLEEAGDDIAGIARHACERLVVLYGEHGPRGYEGGGHPANQGFDPYLDCEVRNVSMIDHWPNAQTTDLDVLMVALPDIGCRHYTYDFFFMVGDDFTPNRGGIDRRTGHEQCGQRLESGESAESILDDWEKEARKFEQIREPYLLY